MSRGKCKIMQNRVPILTHSMDNIQNTYECINGGKGFEATGIQIHRTMAYILDEELY